MFLEILNIVANIIGWFYLTMLAAAISLFTIDLLFQFLDDLWNL
jgi:hypothetical protein